MQIAQELAGYSLGGADLLRRAMGKKKLAEMAKQREIFLAGAAEREVDPDTASYIFDLMEKFAGYGFNKSHSVAYALLSYQTAWLKAHYAAAFMASVLSADMDNTDKVVILIDECRSMGLTVLPPDVNRSQYMFSVLDNKTILYGLGAIKGVGQSAIEGLIRTREQDGPFEDLQALCRRSDMQKLNRRVMEALIRAGGLDRIGPNRATLMAKLSHAMGMAEQQLRDIHMGQNDLFGGFDIPASDTEDDMLPEWEEALRLSEEKETLGLYLTGHPIRQYEAELARFVSSRIGELGITTTDIAYSGRNSRDRPTVVIAGLVTNIRIRNGQSGRMAFLTLDDQSGRIEVGVFPKDYGEHTDMLNKDDILVVKGTLGMDDFSGNPRLRAREIWSISEARAHFAKRLDVKVSASANAADLLIERLMETLEPFREGSCCPVRIDYANAKARADLMLDEAWKVKPTDLLLQRLREIDVVEDARLVYP